MEGERETVGRARNHVTVKTPLTLNHPLSPPPSHSPPLSFSTSPPLKHSVRLLQACLVVGGHEGEAEDGNVDGGGAQGGLRKKGGRSKETGGEMQWGGGIASQQPLDHISTSLQLFMTFVPHLVIHA